ncbi:MAG: FAD-dependent oxidoreductase [Clostridia bacterium]|nr:FAD-dependent oxidoreductase [Clostridia bacterium]
MNRTVDFRDGGKFDVAVIGAGTAGVFAAISAARSGARTLLIEKNSLTGGTMTAAGVDFPGLFHAWGKQIIDGPCFEAIKRCEALGGAVIPEIIEEPEEHWSLQIKLDPFIFTAVTEQMLDEAGVELWYHTMPVSVQKTDTNIEILAACKDGAVLFHANTVIDSTADANICTMLGFASECSQSLQPATLIQDISGYDLKNIDEELCLKLYRKALLNGSLFEGDFQHCTPVDAFRQGRISMHIPCPDVSDSYSRTLLEKSARSALLRILAFLRTVPNAEGVYISRFANECGVRETKRIIGEGYMTVDNYVNGYTYPDAVAYCFYPVDLHVQTGIEQIFLKKGVIPTIPYSALIPKGSDRVLAAGRCASGDAAANSAYRVQASCMAMGQVAGVAAAIAAKDGISVRDVPLKQLREKLLNIGAIVPDL